MYLYPLNITNFKVDGGAMFGVVPKILWEKLYPAGDNNLCNWALRSLLIDTGDRVVLIDNGFGDKQSDKFMSRFHLNETKGIDKALAEYGYEASDVTDMLITHLHYDHCGGGVRYNESKTGFEMTFPNARYLVSKVQWESAMQPNSREKSSFLEENLLPMKESGQMVLIDKDTELFPGLAVRLYNGHTAGQLIPFINNGDSTIVFMADLLPSTAHIPLPYIMSYDMNPTETLKEKESFLEEAVNNNYILFFQHDLYNECCTLQKTTKGIRAKDKFNLEDISPLRVRSPERKKV